MPSQSISYHTAGIYLIRCTANGMVYVGRSNRIRHRWSYHRKMLNEGKAAPAFVRDWQAYGPDSFEWTVLEELPDYGDMLVMIAAEQRWIDHYRANNPRHGYNRAQHQVHEAVIRGYRRAGRL